MFDRPFRTAFAAAILAAMPLTAAAQPAHPASFEVATITPVAKCTSPTAVALTDSGRLTVGCQPLNVLVRLAYLPRLQEGDVTGGPRWADSDLYDLVAKVDEAGMAGWDRMSYRQRLLAVQPLLQQLLAQRFQLRTHIGTHTAEVYALQQSKGGAKLKEVPPPPPHQSAGDAPRESADETPQKSAEPAPGSFRIINNRLVARAVQVQDLLWFFAARCGFEDAPTVDRTGLDGYYDFEMKLPLFSDKAEFERQLNDQLGLRIAQKNAPLPTIVIDRAERPSLDN